MEKRKKTVFVSFASQKGGVGKSTFAIYAASWLHYVKGLNVAIVDCDYPQHSIIKQKKRDMEVVKTTPVYQNLLVEQAGRLKKKAYPVIGSTPADCMTDWRAFEEKADVHYDVGINEYVITDIQHLLKNTDKPIKEVVGLLNFPNISFFGTYCRKHFGMSPTEYRKYLRTSASK